MAELEAAWAEREATRQKDIADAVSRVEALKTQLLQVLPLCHRSLKHAFAPPNTLMLSISSRTH